MDDGREKAALLDALSVLPERHKAKCVARRGVQPVAQPSLSSQFSDHDEQTGQDDLAPAQGILIAILLSAIFWLILGGILLWG